MVRQLVVTRRTIRSCGLFDEERTRLVPISVPGEPPNVQPPPPPYVFEDLIAEIGAATRVTMMMRSDIAGVRSGADLANRLNLFQRRVINRMISGFSAGAFQSRPFVTSDTFLRLAALTAQRVRLDLESFVEANTIPADTVHALKHANIHTLAQLFADDAAENRAVDLDQLGEARLAVLETILAPTKRTYGNR